MNWRITFWLALLALLFLMGGKPLLQWMVHALIYPSPRIKVPSPPPAPYEEVHLAVQGVGQICAWLYRPTAAKPGILIFFHGNGENLALLHLGGVLDRLRELKRVFLAVEYPGYGCSEGKAKEKNLVHAGQAAVQWAKQRFPDQPVILIGWSLGAGVAVSVAASQQNHIQGVVLMSPWRSLPEVAAAHYPKWLVKRVLREAYPSAHLARAIECPALILHGLEDQIIPYPQGEAVAKSWAGPVKWVPLPGAGHNDLLAQERVWQEVAQFLEGNNHSLGGEG